MWKEEDDKLKRTFVFKDFKSAFAFMTKVAAVADRLVSRGASRGEGADRS